jgi:hypothetical protein
MPKLLAKFVLIFIGVAFGVFCLFFAILGAIRFHGWIEVGRLAPPHYPGIEKYDVISFSTDPLRAVLEIGGNALLILMTGSGLVLVILMFRRGVEWMHKLPYVLPGIFVIVFWSTVGAVLVGRTDWVLPASFLLGGVAMGMNWMSLRKKGLPITARLSDMTDAPR